MTAADRINGACATSLLSLIAEETRTGIEVIDADTIQLFALYNRAQGKHWIVIPPSYDFQNSLVLEFSTEEDALSYLESFLQDTATTLGSYN